MTPREQAVELVAVAMWAHEDERASPSVAKSRTSEAFVDADDETRDRWIKLARAWVGPCRLESHPIPQENQP